MKKFVTLTLALAFVAVTSFSFAEEGFKEIKIESGDTLATLATKALKDEKFLAQLLKFNGISHPKDLVVGQSLKVPYSISKDRVARVTMTLGNVKVQRTDGKEEELERGTVLVQNDVIVTAAGAKAEIELDEGTVVRVGPRTKFKMESYAYTEGDRSTNLSLDQGSMSMKVTKMTGGSEFQVSTVTAVAGVRGTFFYVNYDADSKEVGVAVYSGEVVVGKPTSEGKLDTKATTVRVEGGNATTVAPDGTPSKVFPIPGKIQWADRKSVV